MVNPAAFTPDVPARQTRTALGDAASAIAALVQHERRHAPEDESDEARKRREDREKRRRKRRRRAGSSILPPDIREEYSLAQQSVLDVVAKQVQRYGKCVLPNETIAQWAGVVRRTVQYTMQKAKTLGHLTWTERPWRAYKQFSNLVVVTSRDWLGWIKRGAKLKRGAKRSSQGCKEIHPIPYRVDKKQTLERVERPRGGFQGGHGRSRAPQ